MGEKDVKDELEPLSSPQSLKALGLKEEIGLEQLKVLLGMKRPTTSEEKTLLKDEELLSKIKSFLNIQLIELDLKKVKPDLKVGDKITLKIIGHFQQEGQQQEEPSSPKGSFFERILSTAYATTQEEVEFQKASTFTLSYLDPFPTIPGWHPGDGHIHSNRTFPEALFPISLLAKLASTGGLRWLTITDHGDWMDPGEWKEYVKDIDEAQKNTSPRIQVLAGEEVNINGEPHLKPHDSHYLVYNLANYFENRNESRTAWEIIRHVNATGGEIPGTKAFGIIAHPYWAYPWFDNWPTAYKGAAGIEIFSGASERDANAEALRKWDEILREGIHMAGVANSDFHGLEAFPTFGASKTYLYMPTYSYKNHKAVYDALKKGRAVASNGPLAIIKIGTKMMGDTVTASPGQRVKLTIEWPKKETIEHIKVIHYDEGRVNKDFRWERDTTSTERANHKVTAM